jgi:hypothetical protein
MSFYTNHTHAFALGGEPGFRDTSTTVVSSATRFHMSLPGLLRTFEFKEHLPNQAYHPVKCQADARAGWLQQLASRGDPTGELALVSSETLAVWQTLRE